MYDNCECRVVQSGNPKYPIAVETDNGIETDCVEFTRDEVLLLISDLIAAL